VKRRATKVLACISIAAGAAVLVMEVRRLILSQSWEIWIWGAVAVMAIVLGVYELFAKEPPNP
jgi:hypothetical protein